MCAGSSIRACRSLGRHIVALEPDVELFEQVLVPLLPTLEEKSSDSRRDPSPPQQRKRPPHVKTMRSKRRVLLSGNVSKFTCICSFHLGRYIGNTSGFLHGLIFGS